MNGECTFVELLKTAYPAYYKAIWKKGYEVCYTDCCDPQFELKDRAGQMIQKPGEGVAVFGNKECLKIGVVDFERYVNQYTDALQAGSGKKCDFIIFSVEKNAVFVLCELTKTRKDYLDGFVQPRTGEFRTGKREKALEQLGSSIEKLGRVPEIADYLKTIERKVALFAYRIPDGDHGVMGASMAAFSRPVSVISSIESMEKQMNGFCFQQRIYPDSLDL